MIPLANLNNVGWCEEQNLPRSRQLNDPHQLI